MGHIHGRKEDPEIPANMPSQVGEGDLKSAATEDAVFGVIEGDGPNYRNVYPNLQVLTLNETDNS